MRAVLAATEQLFERGTDPSAGGIAKRAGVSIGSLYQYFRGRDDVLESVISDRVRRECDDVIARIQEREGDEPATAVVDYLLETYGSRRTMLHRLMPHLLRVGAKDSVLRERARVAEAIAATLEGPEAFTQAQALVAGVMGVFQTWILDLEWDATPAELRPVLLGMIRGVIPVDAPR